MQKKNISNVLLILFTLCLFLAKGYDLYNSDNADIIPIYQHMADERGYSGEFYMAEEEKPSSSRYFISIIVAFLMNAGISVEVILLAFYVIAFILTAAGIWKLSRRLFESDPAACTISILSLYELTEITFRLGSAGFKFSYPLPSTFAAGICVFACGLYFGVGDTRALLNKTTALFLCGFATLIQAFIGLFFGGVLLAFLLYEAVFRRASLSRPVLALAAGGLLFGIPVVLAFISGMTGAENPLTPAEVVQILARFRQPHHNLPESWARTAYLEFVIVFASTIWMLKELDNRNTKWLTPLILITGTVAFLAVSVNFAATSILPLPFLSKLQSGRAFAPFILAVSIAWGLKMTRLFQAKQYWDAFSILGMLIVPLGGIWLFPFMLLTSNRTPLYQKAHSFGLVIVNFVTASMVFLEPTDQPLPVFTRMALVSALFLTLLLLMQRTGSEVRPGKRDTLFLNSVLSLSSAIFLCFLLIEGPVFLDPPKPYPEMLSLAEKFKATGAKDGLVLSDPWMNESLYFRFYSETGTVISFKCFPHADDGIREWYGRMKKVGGADPEKGNNKGVPFQKRDWQELLSLAREYHASYILINQKWFPELPAAPLAQSGDWLICQTEAGSQ